MRVPVLGMAALLVLGIGPTRARAEEPPIDLSHFTLVFDDEFDTLNVSAHGPGTTWTAHTPWGGDFGDARFTDPGPEFPFKVANGLLSITAVKDPDGRWRSGLLASVDATGAGFSQQYGYFEIRAKLPAGKGLWPAFWLNTVAPKGWHGPTVEIDVFEHYGQFPADFHTGVLVWPHPDAYPGFDAMHAVIPVPAGSLSAEFHRWGVDVEPDWVTVYFDGAFRWRCKTPPEHRNKLMILTNLAMGSGWPINETPNPSVMQVDYIRAYARHPG